MNNTRLAKRISFVVLCLAFLNIYGWSVNHVMSGGTRFGFGTELFKEFISFPTTVKSVMNELNLLGGSNVLLKVDGSLNPKNDLEYNLFAINSIYQDGEWLINLRNLRDDSIYFYWTLSEEKFNKTDREFRNSAPMNSLLLENRSLITFCSETNNLYRFDSESEIIWHNTEKKFDHSLNLAEDGKIWVCSTGESFAKRRNITVRYIDNYITKVDVETGEIVFNKSVSEILIENGLTSFVHGFGDQIDPLHLNDIEPVLEDSEFWRKGDLFLSLRNKSLVVLYRPSTNKILRLIFGEFSYQHDVDIVEDGKISIFNNNVSNLGDAVSSELKGNVQLNGELNFSQIVTYDFADSSFLVPYKEIFVEEEIYTRTQGLHSYLSNGDVFVEATDNGELYIIHDDVVLFRQYANEPKNGLMESPYWNRVYEEIDF